MSNLTKTKVFFAFHHSQSMDVPGQLEGRVVNAGHLDAKDCTSPVPEPCLIWDCNLLDLGLI